MSQLYSFQEKTIERITKTPGNRLIVAYETGLGKTAVALNSAGRLAARRVLIVTPAIVREHWLAEMANWWPTHPKAATITVGRGRESGLSKKALARKEEAYAADVQVVSYALLGEVSLSSWDIIIFDESHRLKNCASKQSRAARQLAKANPSAAILALTATVMPNNIVDVWNQLDILWPGRFGKQTNPKYPSWWFCNRYSVDVGDEYGSKWEGINPVHAKELQAKLSLVCDRVTKHEVAHLLPPFLVSLTKVDGDLPSTDIKEWAQTQGKAKLKAVIEWADDALESGQNICILTHLRETAAIIAENLLGKARVFRITGAETPEQRNAAIAEAAKHPGSVIVATMHSVGIGINLGFCAQVLFAELYYRPETLIQALGRFDGFRAKQPVNCNILCVKGSLDEKIARSVLKKLDSFAAAIKAGVADDKLVESLGSVKMSEDEAIAAMNAALDDSW